MGMCYPLTEDALGSTLYGQDAGTDKNLNS